MWAIIVYFNALSSKPNPFQLSYLSKQMTTYNFSITVKKTHSTGCKYAMTQVKYPHILFLQIWDHRENHPKKWKYIRIHFLSQILCFHCISIWNQQYVDNTTLQLFTQPRLTLNLYNKKSGREHLRHSPWRNILHFTMLLQCQVKYSSCNTL